jgi:hypothetical protein
LLWIQPDTACVDTNISIEFRIPTNMIEPANISLVDNGGFANLVQEYPRINVTDAQNDPNLPGRAYKAAWLVNAYTMLTMNITRPSPDAFGYLKSKFSTTDHQTTGARLNGIYMSNLWNTLFDPDAFVSNYTLADYPDANYSNPWGISMSNFSDITLLCSGVGDLDMANLSNVHVECGMIMGAAQRRDGSKSLVMEPDTWWTQKVYTCASTMKASVKEVRFRWNTTQVTGNTLKALTISNVSDKSYPDQKSMPLWGVETPGMEIGDVPQLWGLISPDLENSVNLSTVRAPHLYLPGYGGSGVLSAVVPGGDNFPAKQGMDNVMSGVYVDSILTSDWTDYSGGNNMAMFKRWQDYSNSAKAMATIPNLIWTDLAANMFVGTRSWTSGNNLPSHLQKRDSTDSVGASTQALVPITVFERQIRYHWPFAIPAFLALLLFGLVLLAALVSVTSGRGLPARVRHYLFHLSSGRLLAEMQHPGQCEKLAPTNEWIARVGRRPSNLTHHGSLAISGTDAASPFLGLGAGHLTGPVGVAREKQHAMVNELTEIGEIGGRASDSDTKTEHSARNHAPVTGYTKLNGNEQEGWRSPAL